MAAVATPKFMFSKVVYDSLIAHCKTPEGAEALYKELTKKNPKAADYKHESGKAIPEQVFRAAKYLFEKNLPVLHKILGIDAPSVSNTNRNVSSESNREKGKFPPITSASLSGTERGKKFPDRSLYLQKLLALLSFAQDLSREKFIERLTELLKEFPYLMLLKADLPENQKEKYQEYVDLIRKIKLDMRMKPIKTMFAHEHPFFVCSFRVKETGVKNMVMGCMVKGCDHYIETVAASVGVCNSDEENDGCE